MNPAENKPSGADDPRWDELVENFRTLDQGTPREPSAAERQTELRQLFSTGPGAVTGPRDYEVEDTEEEFIPDEPAALGSGNPMVNLAWTMAAGGPIGLLLCVIFFRSAPAFVYIGLVALSIIGVVYLVTRLPTERDPGDDGARV